MKSYVTLLDSLLKLSKTVFTPKPSKEFNELYKSLTSIDLSKHYTYRIEYVSCGKPNCSKCPHGGYLYSYHRDKGKLIKRYIGKTTIPIGQIRMNNIEAELLYLQNQIKTLSRITSKINKSDK